MSSSNSKPTGVNLLVILTVIGGIVDLLAAAIFLVVASVSLSWLEILVGLGIGRLVFLIFSALLIGLLFYGVTSLFLAYGLWNGRAWAWTWALTSAIIGLATSIIALGVGIGMIGIGSNAITIYFLTRTEVKAFYGKTALPESTSIPTSRPHSMVERFCLHCGRRFTGNEVYCFSCGSRR